MKNILILFFLFSQYTIWSQCQITPLTGSYQNSAMVCSNAVTTFNVTIQHTAGQSVTYQWFSNGGSNGYNGSPYNNVSPPYNSTTINDITTVSFDITVYQLLNNENYYCVVSYNFGECAILYTGFFSVGIYPSQPLYNLPQSLTICSGDNINLGLSNNANYYTNGNDLVTGENPGQTVYYTSYLNEVLVNNSNSIQSVIYDLYPSGPCPSTIQSVTVNVLPEPEITGDSTLCLNSSVQLTGNGTPSNTNPWHSSNNSVATISNTGLVTAISSGTTNITYTNSQGCSKEIPITVYPSANFNYHFSTWNCGLIDSLDVWVNQPGIITTNEINNGINYNSNGNSYWISNTTSLPELNEYITFNFINSSNGCSYTDSTYINTLQNFVTDQVIDTVIHPCHYFGQFQLPNNDFWVDTSLNIPYEYIINNVAGNDFLHLSNSPNGYQNVNLIGYSQFNQNTCLVDTVKIDFSNYSGFFGDISGNNGLFVCNQDSVILNGIQVNDADSMVWSTNWSLYNNGTISHPNSLNAVYYPVLSDYYNGNNGFAEITLQAFFKHCLFPDTSNIQIYLAKNNLDVGGDITICSQDSFQLNAQGADIISWSNGLNNGTSLTLPVGSYQYVATGYTGINNFCSKTDTLNVVINESNFSVNAGQDVVICFGDSVLLSASSDSLSNIVWSNGVSNSSYFNPLTSQYLVASVTINNCSDSDTVAIVVNQLPSINAGSDQAICEGESLTLNATGSNIIFWSNGLNNGDSFIPSNDTTLIASVTENNCSNSDTLTITLNPQTSSSLNETSTDSYTWNVTGQTYFESGTYVGVIPNQFGCDSTITLNLTISSSSLSQISNTEKLTLFPNPNNGLFEILVGSELLNSNYTIFSSEGREIFNGKMTKQKETIVLPSTIEGGIYALRIKNNVIRVVIVR
jgi:hypothetical protein